MKENQAPVEVQVPAPGIARAAAFALITAGSTTGLAIVRSKVTASLLGPEGLGVISQYLQVAGLAFVPMAIVSGASFVSRAAPAWRERSASGLRSAVSTATSVSVAVGIVCLAATVLLGLTALPAASLENVGLLLAVGLAAAFTSLAVIPTQFLAVIERHDLNSRSAIISGLLGSAVVITGTVVGGVHGQLVAAIFAGAIALAIGLRAIKLALPDQQLFGWNVDRAYLATCLSLGIAGLVAAGAEQLIAFVSRWSISAAAGDAGVGQFHAASALGSTYFSVVLNALSMAAYPRMVTAKTSEALRATVHDALDFVLRYAPPVVVFAMVARGPLVHALYSDRFDPAVSVLGWMIGADVLRAAGWAVGAPLLLQGRLRYFALVQCSYALVGCVSYVLFAEFRGLEGAGPAYWLTSLLLMWTAALCLNHAVPNVVPFRGLLLSSTIAVALAAWQWFPSIWADGFALLLAFVWLWKGGGLNAISRRVTALLRRLRPDPDESKVR